MIKKGTFVRILKDKLEGNEGGLKRRGVWSDTEEIYGIVLSDFNGRNYDTVSIGFKNGSCVGYYSYRFEIVDNIPEIRPRGHTLTKMFV